jgi:hypothetical protein
MEIEAFERGELGGQTETAKLINVLCLKQVAPAMGAEFESADCTASPTVLKRTPWWAEMADRSRSKWRSTAAHIDCLWISQRRVEPSISVKRKATVLVG